MLVDETILTHWVPEVPEPEYSYKPRTDGWGHKGSATELRLLLADTPPRLHRSVAGHVESS